MNDPYESIDLKGSIAGILRDKRTATGLSQDRLAARAGISTRYYQSIEAADNQPSLETVFKLADALGYSYTDLLDPVWASWRKQRKT